MARRLTALTMALLLTLVFPLIASACATCGCSEVCPVAMMETEGPGSPGGGGLSDSIWGNMILKMAYAKDPQIQKLTKRLGITNLSTMNAIAVIAGATLAQNTVSMAMLNPPEGFEDSYTPGIIGLSINGAVNIAFGSRMALGWKIRRDLRKRQKEIKGRVEGILNHLEFSQTTCAEAQRDLTDIIGERGAKDCVGLWQSCHVTAAILPKEGEGTN